MSDPGDLERLLDALARADAAGLLDEARREARDRVRARLADELARRLLAEVSGTTGTAAGATRPGSAGPAGPEEAAAVEASVAGPDRAQAAAAAAGPAPPASDDRPSDAPPAGPGVYVYAVVDQRADERFPGELRGIAGAPVRLLPAADGSLRAVVGEVPLDQFGDEALKRNLNELPWLSETAMAHEAVVEAARGAAAVVPMRLCTIFRDDRAARDMLARERADLEEALRRLDGTHEWGVKVIADENAVVQSVVHDSDRVAELRQGDAAAGEGAGYFASLRLEQATREEVEARLDEHVRDIHEAVAWIAMDSRRHPPSNRELAGYEGDMVLNAAYLVSEARTDELRGLVASLAERHRPHGLTVELTGPWPPYNFSMCAGAL